MKGLPILAAGAAALLLLGGKRKSKPTAEPDVAPDEAEGETSEEDVEGEGETPPIIGEDEGVDRGEVVSRGIRKDSMGHVGWQVRREADGFHAQIMTGTSNFESVAEDLGVTATVGAARKLLRDTFNQRLLEKWPKAQPINEPKISEFEGATKYLAKTSGGGGGGGGGGGVDFG